MNGNTTISTFQLFKLFSDREKAARSTTMSKSRVPKSQTGTKCLFCAGNKPAQLGTMRLSFTDDLIQAHCNRCGGLANGAFETYVNARIGKLKNRLRAAESRLAGELDRACGCTSKVWESIEERELGEIQECEHHRNIRQERDKALAALEALTCWSMNGEQLCFRSHNGIPMGMSKKQERLARIAIAAQGERQKP